MTKKNINYKFMILQSIAMILIVLGHSGGLTLLTDWFPTDSFIVPMFIFISGYFYKEFNEGNIFTYIKYKFKNLIIPLYLWNIFYGIMITILLNNNIVEYGKRIGIKSYFIDPWIIGNQFGLNAPSWFITILFLIQIIYIILRKLITKVKLNTEYIILIGLIITGVLGVWIANKGYKYDVYLLITRCMFLIQFYHFGYFYKKKIEGRLNSNNLLFFIIIFAVQFILITKYKNVTYVAFSSEFNKENILLPLITSVLGIALWLKISGILVPALKDSKVVRYIATNTWTIMMHHQFVFFIINLIFLFISKYISIINFNIQEFRVNDWYKYCINYNGLFIFNCLLGVLIPLGIKLGISKLNNRKELINIVKKRAKEEI